MMIFGKPYTTYLLSKIQYFQKYSLNLTTNVQHDYLKHLTLTC